MANNLQAIKTFWMYVKSKWLLKTEMWVVVIGTFLMQGMIQMWPLKITMQI